MKSTAGGGVGNFCLCMLSISYRLNAAFTAVIDDLQHSQPQAGNLQYNNNNKLSLTSDKTPTPVNQLHIHTHVT